MAVAFDAVGPAGGAGTNSATTPLAWTHICGGSATAIVIGVTSFSGSSNLVTGVTYGGQTCTLLTYQVSGTAGAGGIALYYLGSPPTGSNTVSVAFTGGGDTIGGSISATGSSGHGTVFSSPNNGSTTSFTQSVTGTTTGGMIVSVACFGGGGTSFSGTNGVTLQFSRLVSVNSASDSACGGTVVSTGGGASQTVGFSETGGAADNWGIIAVELDPSGGPATGPVFRQAVWPARAPVPQVFSRGRVYRNQGAPVRNPQAGPPLQAGPLPNFPAIIVTGAGWRGAGHSR